MTQRPIIDAGPGLNFLSINKERLLIAMLGQLSAPAAVEVEVLRKAAQDQRFRPAAATWKKLTPTWIQILPDDLTPELAQVVNRITQQPMTERLRQSKDLGETMVIAHAVVAAEAGADVIVLIDDGLGARTATREIRRLDRRRTTDSMGGSISLASTLTVLKRAAGTTHVSDKAQMREIYQRLRNLDDGLPPIEKTTLLSTTHWKSGT
jgi:predicted nucleic acid-binding protein